MSEAALEQIDKIVARGLHNIFVSASFEGGDGDAAFLRARDVDNRRAARQLAQFPEGLQPIHPGHVMVDRDQVETAIGRNAQALVAACSGHDDMTSPSKQLLDQPACSGIIVDVQDTPRFVHQMSTSGTWITDRNKPSWRIASAKLS
jgi:hypothetical protein